MHPTYSPIFERRMRELLTERELKAYKDYAFNYRVKMNQRRLNSTPPGDNYNTPPEPSEEVLAILAKMEADPVIAECLANFADPTFEKFYGVF